VIGYEDAVRDKRSATQVVLPDNFTALVEFWEFRIRTAAPTTKMLLQSAQEE
jgi:hypothetical protein